LRVMTLGFLRDPLGLSESLILESTAGDQTVAPEAPTARGNRARNGEDVSHSPRLSVGQYLHPDLDSRDEILVDKSVED
jgi:hypothetical protein